MTRALLLASLALLLMAVPSAWAAQRKGKDKKADVKGSVWHYVIEGGGRKEKGQFRVFEREIFKGADKVGRVEVKDGDETTLFFTGIPELNGKAVLRKTKTNPPGARGTLKKNDGTEWDMKVNWKDG